MKLHGHTKLREGKHKNQNHALIITCREAFQTVDMIQDNYMKERLERADRENYAEVVKVLLPESSFPDQGE